MVMVCDSEKKSSAVGGIMGGLHGEITDGTVNVLISQRISTFIIRRTAKSWVTNDAAYRFEREWMKRLSLTADRAAAYPASSRRADCKRCCGCLPKQPEKRAAVRYARQICSWQRNRGR